MLLERAQVAQVGEQLAALPRRGRNTNIKGRSLGSGRNTKDRSTDQDPWKDRPRECNRVEQEVVVMTRTTTVMMLMTMMMKLMMIIKITHDADTLWL
jgi:hypothetical protein